MDQRYARIAAVMSCLLGGSAFAQQNQDRPSNIEPAQPATPQATTGANTEEAKSAARSLSDVQAEGIRLSQLDRQQVMELQRALQEAGYYTAAIDGIAGSRTKQALRQFYGDQAQLAAQGMISARGAAALGLDQAEIQRVRGEDRPAAKQAPEPPEQTTMPQRPQPGPQP
jgi:peptidoglycan hydrolase-like protein with peptidoglycan-binding domain